MGDHKEEEEAVRHGELALIDNRPEAMWRVDGEVRHGHLTAGDEGRDAREQSEGDEQAAAELDDPRDHHLGVTELRSASQHAEKLLCSVAGEEKPDNHPNKSEGHVNEGAATVCHNRYIIT